MPTTRIRTGAVAAACLLVALVAVPGADAQTGGAGGELPTAPLPRPAGTSPFNRDGMWIWYVDRSEGGSVRRILRRARRAGIGTVYVKSGDAGNYWSQFSRSLVRRLKGGGLDVCAWQFVYGDNPVAEAKIAAVAARRGADCLVIDAEGHYEGKYAAADRYLRVLRARIGPRFPLSLASFPYVDYHPSFPYSVFLGPGGATVNQPQMYWDAIETSVRAVFEHTYLFNRLWGRPIYPIGQTYGGVSRKEILQFRRFSESYGGRAPSWWSWQETTTEGWGALGRRIPGPVAGYEPVTDHPLLRRRSRGDLVVWAQMHLRGAGARGLPISGIYGRRTWGAVRAFQGKRGLRRTGRIDTRTWRALLKADPVRPRWAGAPQGRRSGARSVAGATASRAAGGPAAGAAPAGARTAGGEDAARAAAPIAPRRPLSASLPAHAYEIDPGPRQ